MLCRINAASYGKPPSQMATALHLARAHRAAVYLIRPEGPVNGALFDLRSPDVRVLPEVSWVSAWLRRGWSTLVRVGDAGAAAQIDTSESIARTPVRVALRPRAEQRAMARARTLGVPVEGPLVTLHAREDGFKGSVGQAERGKDAIRSCRVETYFDALDDLVRAGRTIVRIGDPTMTPVNRAGVVDLATSPQRDEWVELWCLLRSEFFIACQSGPYALAILTNTPVLMVNVANPLAAYPHRKMDLYILKHVIERSTGRELSLRELLRDGATQAGDLARYGFVDNSSEELVQAVAEMAEVVRVWPEATPAQDEYARAIRQIQTSARSLAKLAHKGFTRAPFERQGRIAAFFAERYLGGGTESLAGGVVTTTQ
ncbi:MAG: TIGR04372 family glycosyltransferase [Vicinamibacterales bacterium]